MKKRIFVMMFILAISINFMACNLLMKMPPELNAEIKREGFNSVIEVYVKCEEDYKEVNVELNIFDEDGVVIEHYILTGTDYSAGNTYRLTQKLSITTTLTSEKISYKVKDYK